MLNVCWAAASKTTQPVYHFNSKVILDAFDTNPNICTYTHRQIRTFCETFYLRMLENSIAPLRISVNREGSVGRKSLFPVINTFTKSHSRIDTYLPNEIISLRWSLHLSAVSCSFSILLYPSQAFNCNCSIIILIFWLFFCSLIRLFYLYVLLSF